MTDGITEDQLQYGVVCVFSKTVTLNNAQFKALPTTPVEIVPAPGPGKIILWLAGWVVFDNSAGAYDVADALLQMVYLSSPFPIEISGFVKIGPVVTNPGIWSASIPPLAGYDAVENYLYYVPVDRGIAPQNAGLGIADVYNGVPDYTGGNAANTLRVTVLYTIIDV